MIDPARCDDCGRDFRPGDTVHVGCYRVRCDACRDNKKHGAPDAHVPTCSICGVSYLPWSSSSHGVCIDCHNPDAATAREIDRQMEKVEQDTSPNQPWAVCYVCKRGIVSGSPVKRITDRGVEAFVHYACAHKAFPPTIAESVESQLREMGVK